MHLEHNKYKKDTPGHDKNDNIIAEIIWYRNKPLLMNYLSMSTSPTFPENMEKGRINLINYEASYK